MKCFRGTTLRMRDARSRPAVCCATFCRGSSAPVQLALVSDRMCVCVCRFQRICRSSDLHTLALRLQPDYIPLVISRVPPEGPTYVHMWIAERACVFGLFTLNWALWHCSLPIETFCFGRPANYSNCLQAIFCCANKLAPSPGLPLARSVCFWPAAVTVSFIGFDASHFSF